MARNREPFWNKGKFGGGKGKKASALISTLNTDTFSSLQSIKHFSAGASVISADSFFADESRNLWPEHAAECSNSQTSSPHSCPVLIPPRTSSRSPPSAYAIVDREEPKVGQTSFSARAAPAESGASRNTFSISAESLLSGSLDSALLGMPVRSPVHGCSQNSDAGASSLRAEFSEDEPLHSDADLNEATSRRVGRERSSPGSLESTGSPKPSTVGQSAWNGRIPSAQQEIVARLLDDDMRRVLEVMAIVVVAIVALSFGRIAAVVATGGVASLVLYLQKRFPLATPARNLDIGTGISTGFVSTIGFLASTSAGVKSETVSVSGVPTADVEERDAAAGILDASGEQQKASSPQSDLETPQPSPEGHQRSTSADLFFSPTQDVQLAASPLPILDKRRIFFSQPHELASFLPRVQSGGVEQGARMQSQAASSFEARRHCHSGPLLSQGTAATLELSDSRSTASRRSRRALRNAQEIQAAPLSVDGAGRPASDSGDGMTVTNVAEAAISGKAGESFPESGDASDGLEFDEVSSGSNAGLGILRQSSDAVVQVRGQKSQRGRLGRWLSVGSPTSGGDALARTSSAPPISTTMATAKASKLPKLFSVRRAQGGVREEGGKGSNAGVGGFPVQPLPALALSQSAPLAPTVHTITLPPASTVQEVAMPAGSVVGLSKGHIFPRVSRNHSGNLGRLDEECEVTSAKAWDGKKSDGSTFVLFFMLVLVLCCLFLGRLPAIIATSFVGLLASQITRSMHEREEGVSGKESGKNGKGGGRTVGKASQASGLERQRSGSPRSPTIADILQHSHVSDPRTQAILEGLLNRTGRGASSL